jgi:hypothetical protein
MPARGGPPAAMLPRSVLPAVVLAAAALAATAPPPAAADAGRGGGAGVVVAPVDPHGRLEPPRVGVGVTRPGSTGLGSTGPGGAGADPAAGRQAPACVYTPEPGLEPGMRRVGVGGTPPPGAHLYSLTCGAVAAGLFWLTPTRPGPAGARDLAARAYRELVLPAPVIRTSPPVGVPQLVRVPTWLWIEAGGWAPRQVTARVPGLSATVTATPVQVRWSLGDGAWLVCTGPGAAYVPAADAGSGSPDCGHTYTRAGTVRLTATLTWRVRWVGGGTAGTLPALVSTSSQVLRVIEAQTANR